MKLPPSAATIAASANYDRNVEGKIQRTIEQWLELHGVFVIRSQMNKRTTTKPGTPDLLFCYDQKPFALEIKRPGKKPTKEQNVVIEHMANNGWITGWFFDAKTAIDFIDSYSLKP